MKPIPTTMDGMVAELRQRRKFLAVLGSAFSAGDSRSVIEMLTYFCAAELNLDEPNPTPADKFGWLKFTLPDGSGSAYRLAWADGDSWILTDDFAGASECTPLQFVPLKVPEFESEWWRDTNEALIGQDVWLWHAPLDRCCLGRVIDKTTVAFFGGGEWLETDIENALVWHSIADISSSEAHS